MSETMFGVYRVLKDGSHRYLSRSATSNRKLAEEIAAERSAGEITLMDGSVAFVPRHPHIVKEIRR